MKSVFQFVAALFLTFSLGALVFRFVFTPAVAVLFPVPSAPKAAPAPVESVFRYVESKGGNLIYVLEVAGEKYVFVDGYRGVAICPAVQPKTEVLGGRPAKPE